MAQHSQYSSPIHAFPRSLTSFVGRERELREIVSQLADPACRLLTLVGPGGVGKTRLAVEVAVRVTEDFPDGLWFVPLQAVDSPELLAPAIRDSVSISPSHHIGPLQAVVHQLQNQRVLLVLDNLEHLLDGLDALVAILQQTDGVKLLVTSRQSLNLAGEWRYEIEGLDVSADVDAINYGHEDAAQLFVDRARQVRHDFAPETELDEILRICQLVDGIPLAIELAARWLGAMDCAEIAGEIERNLDFLASEQRDLPERHRSMRAVIDHSWRHLSGQDQAACMRLSVFRGGFQRSAAEAVAGASLPILTRLVHRSLLHWDPTHRLYQMHELLRQYAAEMLADSTAEEDVTHDAHCAYYADFLQQRFDYVLGNWRRETIPEIEAQIDNIRAAWSWAAQQGMRSQLRAMTIPLCELFQIKGQYAEAVAVLDRVIACGGHLFQDAESQLAHVLTRRGSLLVRLGRIDEAEGSLLEAEAIYERLGVSRVPGQNSDPAFSLGLIALIHGDYATAEALGEEVRQRSEAGNHQFNLEVAYYLLARVALEQGQIDQARQHAQMARDIAIHIDDQWFLAYCLTTLGDVAVVLDDLDAAKQHYSEAHAIRKTFNDLEGMALALVALGKVAATQRDYVESVYLCGQGWELYQRTGDKGGLAAALDGLARAELGLDDLESATQHLLLALQLAQEIKHVPLILEICLSAGRLYLQAGARRRGLDLLSFVWRNPSSPALLRVRAENVFSHDRADLAPEFLALRADSIGPDDLDDVTHRLLADLTQPADGPAPDAPAQLIEPLSEREQEVLAFIALGLKNREIADRLSVSTNTIKSHIQHIYGKLGVNSRVAAINRAQSLNLL